MASAVAATATAAAVAEVVAAANVKAGFNSLNKSQQQQQQQQPSSLRSRSNSRELLYNQVAVDLNISHEDLSDVSDIDMEKQAPPSKSSSRNADDDNDDDDDGAISNDSLPVAQESSTGFNGKLRNAERKSSLELSAEIQSFSSREKRVSFVCVNVSFTL